MSNQINSIKAKLVSKLPTGNDETARMKHACSTTISALETTLNIAKEAPDLLVCGREQVVMLFIIGEISDGAPKTSQL